jgi:cation diffusion facilitator family transporter
MSGYAFIDPIAGFLVALFIVKTGYDVGKDNIDMLMGRVSDTGLMDEIEKLALNIQGVKGVHSIKIRYVGVVAHVQLHIEVDENMKIIDADKVAHRVQAKLVSQLEDVGAAIIHVCPCKEEKNA